MPPATPPNSAPGHGSGKRHISKWKEFALLWAAVYIIQSLSGLTDYKEKLISWDESVTHSLEGLDPFVLATDFYDRWNQPHSLRIWSISAPFNVRVHDDKILDQLRELTAQAPKPPERPDDVARRKAVEAMVFGNAGVADFPAPDPAAEASAAARYESDCQDFLARYRAWERPYHDLARGLTNFDEAAYSEQMQRSCGGGQAEFSTGARLLGGPSFYDRTYGPTLLNPQNEEESLPAAIWQHILGLPDALIFAVGSALSHGAFQAFMAVFLLVLTYGIVAKGKPIIVLPMLPLLAGVFVWIVLKMVHLAHDSLHSVMSITAIPMVGSLSIWPIGGLVEALRSIVEHDAAHRLASAAENIIK